MRRGNLRRLGAGQLSGLCLLIAILVAGVRLGAQQGSGPPSGAGRPERAWDHFTADLTVRHRRVTADGVAAGIDPPVVVLRLERKRTGQSWRTSLALRSAEPASIQSPAGRQSLDNPFAITRLEYDEDGTPPRMYDRAGQLASGPTADDLRLLGLPDHLRNRDWDADSVLARIPSVPPSLGDRGPAPGLVVQADARASRRGNIERRFGRSVGRVRGLDRFLEHAGKTVRELLVNPEFSLPVELSVAENGQLMRHATFDYEFHDATTLLRRRARTEHVLPESGGMRLITEVELSDVALTEGARQ